MSDYINREDALSACKALKEEYIGDKKTMQQVNDFVLGILLAEAFIKARIEDIPAADVCPYYISNKHDRGDDSLCIKAGCEVKDVRPVVRGKWVSPFGIGTVCNQCGYDIEVHVFEPNFCPNCGAEMEAET